MIVTDFEVCGIYKLEVESIAEVVDIEDCITNQREVGTALSLSVLWHKRPVAHVLLPYAPLGVKAA